MIPLVCDVETTTFKKGNPFSKHNSLCYIGFFNPDIGFRCYNLLDNPDSYREALDFLKSDNFQLIGANFKYDLHWLRRYGYKAFSNSIWDVQLAYFILTNQKNAFPSLNDIAEYFGFEGKIDIVKEQFWNKGIDTPDIPKEIMTEYLEQDCRLTYQCYEAQKELFKGEHKSKYMLFRVHSQDELVLEDMEYNGLLIDETKANKLAEIQQEELKKYEAILTKGYEGVPINFGSSEQVSAYLYGGTIIDKLRVPVGTYKTGAKAGQTRYKILVNDYVLPRMVAPLPKTEMAKEGIWSTDKKVLTVLYAKAPKEIRQRIEALQMISKISKQIDTYLVGLPKKNKDYDWPTNKIHGTFNQCRVITGRLSSSEPNLQNFDGKLKDLFISEYDNQLCLIEKNITKKIKKEF